MPRKPTKERVSGQYFHWLVGTRNGVYYADGRGNSRKIGRHSLGTRDHSESLQRLHRLDLVKAVEFGLAKRDILSAQLRPPLSLEEGRDSYLQFAARPPIQGGATPGTVKRYRTALDKFVKFAHKTCVRHWDAVNANVLRRYGSWMNENDYHDKTQYIELTILKQVINWLVSEEFLPPISLASLKLKKPHGTRTYCYTQEQVDAIVSFCTQRAELHWLGNIVITLVTTGLRIGELAELRWSDLDLERGNLTLQDTTRAARKSERQKTRRTKSHCDRTLPIHPDLRAVLERLPHLADGRVFHGPKAGKLKPDTVRNVLVRDVLHHLAVKFPRSDDDRGIEAGRLHSFRHYFCSISADQDVSEQMLMTWLGHRDSEMVRHYYHLRQEVARTQMAKIAFLGTSIRTGASNEGGKGVGQIAASIEFVHSLTSGEK